MSDRDIPSTSFGGVPIRILWPETSLSMPDWQPVSLRNTRHIPGSNRNVTQTLGLGQSTLTHRIWLDTLDDYRALEARLQTTGALVLVAEMTTIADTYVDIHGEGHIQIDDVLLADLTDKQIFPDDGGPRVEVTAVFEKSFTEGES